MFAINIIPPEAVITPEEKKTKLITEAHGLIQHMYSLKITPPLVLINLRWGASNPANVANVDGYIQKLTSAVAEAKIQISSFQAAKRQAELVSLKDAASLLIAQAKQMRTSLKGSIAHESQTTLLDLRVELENAVRSENPTAELILEKMNALSVFLNPRSLADDSPELKGRRLS